MTAEHLIAAGWTRTRSGRWSHPAFPGQDGRRKLFTEDAALSLLDAAPDHPQRTPREIVENAIDEALRIEAQLVTGLIRDAIEESAA